MSTDDEKVNEVIDGLRRYWPPFAAQTLRGKLNSYDSDYVTVFVEWHLFYCHASVTAETRQYHDARVLQENRLYASVGREPPFKSLDERWERYLKSTASELYAAIKEVRFSRTRRYPNFNKWVPPASRWYQGRKMRHSTCGFRRNGKPVEAAR